MGGKIAEGYVPVTGGRVWYWIVGEGPGIPLLTLYGGPGMPSDYLMPLLPLAEGRPVILYDQLRCGYSDRSDDSRLWVLERFVEELKQVREALGLERFHLLGQSWGSMLAIEYAITQPLGLTSLILAGPVTSVPHHNREAERLKRLLPVEMQQAIERHEAAGTTDAPEYQAAFKEWLRRHMAGDEAVLRELERLCRFGDPETGPNWEIMNIMWGPGMAEATGSLWDWDRTDRLAKIKLLTLFICGRHDECTPGATAWYQSLLPGPDMVVFERSAHLHHMEEPERFLEVVRDFLQRAEETAADRG